MEKSLFQDLLNGKFTITQVEHLRSTNKEDLKQFCSWLFNHLKEQSDNSPFNSNDITKQDKYRISLLSPIYSHLLLTKSVTIFESCVWLFNLLDKTIESKKIQTEEQLFSGKATWNYFATKVLDKLEPLLLCMNISTLKLLCDNVRLVNF